MASISHLTNGHRVCQLCWSVYLAEKELWKVHRAIARIVTNKEAPGDKEGDDNFDFTGLLDDLPLVGNIRAHHKSSCQRPARQPSQTKLLAIKDATSVVPGGPTGLAGSAIKGTQVGDEGLQSPRPEYLHQWRLMILLWSLEGLPYSTNRTLEYEVLGMCRRFSLRNVDEHVLPIGRIALHYLFSSTTRLSLPDSYIEFLVTAGGSLYHGRCSIGHLPGLTKRTIHVVLSARGAARSLTLKVTLGIVQDSTIHRDYCDVQRKLDGIFIVAPGRFYSSHHLLPGPWVETLRECTAECSTGNGSDATSATVSSVEDLHVEMDAVKPAGASAGPAASRPTTSGRSTRPPSAAHLLDSDRKSIARVPPPRRLLSRRSDSLGSLNRSGSGYRKRANSAKEMHVAQGLVTHKLVALEEARMKVHLQKLRRRLGPSSVSAKIAGWS